MIVLDQVHELDVCLQEELPGQWPRCWRQHRQEFVLSVHSCPVVYTHSYNQWAQFHSKIHTAQ